MKNMAFFSLFICYSAINCMNNNTDFINKYLPENSIIRKKHNTEPRGTECFGHDSSIRSACDELNATFRLIISKKGIHPSEASLILGQHLTAILKDENYAVLSEEEEWIFELQRHLQRKREAASPVKDPSIARRAAIRAAIEQRDQNEHTTN